MKRIEILASIKQSVVDGEAEKTEELAKRAVEKEVDPFEAIDKLAEGLREVGKAFEREEVFLFDMVMSADAMKKAIPILEESIRKMGKTRKADKTLVIGTVAGDIHDIGKTIVSTLFTAAGFKVYDLGIDVPADKFAKSIVKYKPDLLGLSALLASTRLQMHEVIKALKEKRLRSKVKVIVGGGAVSKSYAEEIGADGYAANAQEAVRLGEKLMDKEGD